MVWIIIAILAGMYLAVRFIQITQFVVTRFLFNPALPLPIKVVSLAVVVAVIWGIRKWWRWYLKKPGPAERQT